MFIVLNTLLRDFYDAFVTIHPNLFNARDKHVHTRKRKIISHSFSAKSVAQFEQYMHSNIDEFIRQWDTICSKATGSSEYVRIDCLEWFNYLAFDTISDLTFGTPFGSKF